VQLWNTQTESGSLQSLVLREQFGHHGGRDVYVLNGIEVGEMRDDTCSPRVIVHVSLVSRLFKNSRACALIHNMFFVYQDYVIGWWQHCLVLTPGYSSLATLTARYISKNECNPECSFDRGPL